MSKPKTVTNTDDTRPFTIQAGKPYRDKTGKMIYPKCSTIPWWLAKEAYQHYQHKYGGNAQSLEKLAERGGFGRGELLALLRRENW